MKRIFGFVALVGVLLTSKYGWESGTFRPVTQPSEPAKARVPVLVELFTSEGCNSCPPADELVAQLQKDQPIDRALIIPLSEHVDYWNTDAWRDRFSSALFSQRQSHYVHSMRLEGPYTPQMVVDGRSEFVGSDGNAATEAIDEAARKPHAKIDFEQSTLAGGSFGGQVHVTGLSGVQKSAESILILAITEDNLQTHVGGGENGGRTLSHSAVVRLMKTLGPVAANSTSNVPFKVAIKDGWNVSHLSAVVFLQDPTSGRILGSGIEPIRTGAH